MKSRKGVAIVLRRAVLAAGALAAALVPGACGSGRPIRYYTIDVPPAPQPSSTVYPVTVLIGRIGAPDILEDQSIAYRTGANEIGVYQYHQWIEPPPQMVRVALLRLLRASGRFRSVSESGSSAQGDFVLQGRLYEFEEVDTGTIAARVSMGFELLNHKTHQTVWTHFYSNTDRVQGKEIPDVVSALDRNLLRGLDEVASGLDSYFATHEAAHR